MRIRRRRRPSRLRRKWRLLLLLCLLIYILTAQLLSPMAVELAQTEIQRVALESVYEAVEEVIPQSQQNLTDVTQRSDGSIAAVEADPQALAVLQASLSTAISQKLSQNRTAGIRLGNLTPVALLSGKGPEIHLKLKPEGTAQVDVSSEFSSAGINQTLHCLRLDITVHLTIHALWYTEPQEISTSLVVGETLIVGEPPTGWYRMSDSS